RQNGCALPTLVPGNDALVDGNTAGFSVTVPFATVPVLPAANWISRTFVSVVPVACSAPFTTSVTSFSVAPSTTNVPLTVTVLPWPETEQPDGMVQVAPAGTLTAPVTV